MSGIEDRRQRAREEYHDNGGAPDARGDWAPVEMAIRVATQVKLTPTMLNTVRMHASDKFDDYPSATQAIIQAFCDLTGFEVIE